MVVVATAGKTAFANSVIGRPFENTESTVGINQLTCDIKYASVGTGSWNEYEKPGKEMEAAVASMIANGFNPAEADAEESHKKTVQTAAEAGKTSGGVPMGKGFSINPNDLRDKLKKTKAGNNSSATERGGESVALDSGVSGGSGGADSTLGKYMGEGSGGDDEVPTVSISEEEAKQFDNELVMKCLSDKMQTDSKFIISVFDFGGQSVFNVSGRSSAA